MSDHQNLGGSDRVGSGSESAMDMVLDNLGMEDELAENLEGGGERGGEDESGGRDEYESGQQQYEPEQYEPQRQQPQRQQPQRGLPQGAEVRADQRGNLIGPDGKVVAKAGFEARMYQETQRSRRELAVEQTRSQDLSSRLSRAIELGQQFHQRVESLTAQLNDRNTAASRLGLNDSESIQAMQLASEAKRDPVATIKKILTMAAAAGVDVTRIGIAPGGVDTAALMGLVQNEIRGAMTPLQQRMQAEQLQTQQQEVAQRIYRETENELNSFFSANPAAREYIPVFHAVLSEPRFQHMSMGEVWARIQLNQMRTNGNGNGHLRSNPQQRRNLPSGRGQPYNGGTGDMAPVNQSYDAILRETLDALGV
jgi:hypothetical protein